MIPSTGSFFLSLPLFIERIAHDNRADGFELDTNHASIGSNRRRRNFVRLIEPNVRCVSRNDRLPFPPSRILFLFFVPLYRGSLAWVSFYAARFVSPRDFFFFFYQRDFFSTRKEIFPSESFINKFKNLNSLSLLFRDRSLKFPNFISGSARKIKIREKGRQMGLLMREIICRKYGKKRWRGGKKGEIEIGVIEARWIIEKASSIGARARVGSRALSVASDNRKRRWKALEIGRFFRATIIDRPLVLCF